MTRAEAGCGLLFDIDGTLAETDPLHIRAFNAVMAPWGVSFDLPTYNRMVIGRTNAAIFADILPHESIETHRRVADEKEAAFRALAAGTLAPAAGLLDLLAWADRHDVACACVTNAPRANADMILDALRLRDRFRAIVIGDDLAHGKPHPLPYLTGAARIGADPRRCVAFEDSRSGVTSAVAAGAVTVGMTTSLAEADLVAAGVRIAVRDFTDQRVMPLLAEVFAG